MHQTVVVLDFGSQFTQLIARRLRESRVYCEVLPCDASIERIRSVAPGGPIGLVLSGGPQSVGDPGSPQAAAELFELGIPVLGICYGMQAMARTLGGRVEPGASREYGRAEIEVRPSALADGLFRGLESRQTVWMSHGDHVAELPAGFEALAGTAAVPFVACVDRERRIFAVQFHPEVSHTAHGAEILANFLDACGARHDWTMASYLEEATAAIRSQVGTRRVLCALSGGVDSSVVAALLKRAIGDQMTAVFVDTGLLRKDERRQVETSLRDGLGIPIRVVDASRLFLSELAGVNEPEHKRKIIGKLFIDVFVEESRSLGTIDFLAQGTLYPDVIESTSVKGPSAVIKTHHNVGGLPERLGFELIEPLRHLFKDEVRQLGRELGLPEFLVARHPFPGPGLAVRVLGEVTEERLRLLREADAIFIDELRSSGWYEKTSQAFAVFLPVKSVGVMGDFRTYENVVALRAVETQDFMTADWSQLPHELLGRVANRIVNEVRGLNRVVYDVTSKPPGTIEWE